MNLHLDLEAQRSEPDYVVYKPGAAGSLPADPTSASIPA